MNRRNRFAPLSPRGLVLILPLLGLLAPALFLAGPQPTAQADHDPPVAQPDPPTGVGLRLAYETGIVLEWNPPPDGWQIHYYLIELRLLRSGDDESDWRQTTLSAFTAPRNGKLRGGFHDLDQATQYELRVSACLDPNLGADHLAGDLCSDPRPRPMISNNPLFNGKHFTQLTTQDVPSPPRNLVATPGEQVGLSDTTGA